MTAQSDAAELYARRGWHVLPVAPGGKVPMLHDWPSQATSSLEAVRAWWGREPNANVGIVCDRAFGFVLDVDDPEALDFMPELPHTLTAKTPSGGRHYVFLHPAGADLDNGNKGLLGWLGTRGYKRTARGVDIRGSHGQIVVAPSVRADSTPYAWVDESAPIAPAPLWLLEAIRYEPPVPRIAGGAVITEPRRDLGAYKRAAVDGECRTLAEARPGSRGRAAYSAGAQLGSLGLTLGETESELVPMCERNGLVKTDGINRVRREIARGWEKGAANLRPEPADPRPVQVARVKAEAAPPMPDVPHPADLEDEDSDQPKKKTPPPSYPEGFRATDLSAALRFVAMYSDDLRYVRSTGNWHVWDGSVWAPDKKGIALKRCAESARKHKLAMINFGDDEAMKDALKAEARNRIEGALALAGVQDQCAMSADAFDRDPWLLACPNGTIDLTTGKLRSAKREDCISQRVPVEYDRAAQATTWERFMAQVLPDESVLAFVQRFLGYCLTGSVREHALLLAVGTGRNGKSTLFETFASVMGELAGPAAPGLLLKQKFAQHPAELADIHGKRMVYVSEVQKGSTFDEERVKRLTGGDKMKARGMRENFYEFAPTHKLVIYVNDLPRVRDPSDGYWRRMRVVRFGESFRGREDKALGAKLLAERKGILAWAVRGCVDWYENGLGEPASVTAETAKYQNEEDVIQRWLDDRSARDMPTRGRASDLYADFVTCVGKDMSATKFGKTLAERGFERSHTAAGAEWSLVARAKQNSEQGSLV